MGVSPWRGIAGMSCTSLHPARLHMSNQCSEQRCDGVAGCRDLHTWSSTPYLCLPVLSLLRPPKASPKALRQTESRGTREITSCSCFSLLEGLTAEPLPSLGAGEWHLEVSKPSLNHVTCRRDKKPKVLPCSGTQRLASMPTR